VRNRSHRRGGDPPGSCALQLVAGRGTRSGRSVAPRIGARNACVPTGVGCDRSPRRCPGSSTRSVTRRPALRQAVPDRTGPSVTDRQVGSGSSGRRWHLAAHRLRNRGAPPRRCRTSLLTHWSVIVGPAKEDRAPDQLFERLMSEPPSQQSGGRHPPIAHESVLSPSTDLAGR
jgi:hypothetical protein